MNAIGWTTLVQPEAVAAALGEVEVVLVDCRFSLADPAAGERAYRDSHIPGARYAHLDRDLSGPGAASRGRHPWPEADALTGRLSAWGISPRSRVVAYDAGDGAHAARRGARCDAGHEAVAVLDGGCALDRAGCGRFRRRPGARAYAASFDVGGCSMPTPRPHLDRGGLLSTHARRSVPRPVERSMRWPPCTRRGQPSLRSHGRRSFQVRRAAAVRIRDPAGRTRPGSWWPCAGRCPAATPAGAGACRPARRQLFTGHERMDQRSGAAGRHGRGLIRWGSTRQPAGRTIYLPSFASRARSATAYPIIP